MMSRSMDGGDGPRYQVVLDTTTTDKSTKLHTDTRNRCLSFHAPMVVVTW